MRQTAKPRGRLRLSPGQVLRAIQANAVATWALEMAHRFQPQQLPKGSGGQPRRYSDGTILLMAVVQALWRKPYRQMVPWVAVDVGLTQVLGFPVQDGQSQTISQGHYWERCQALGSSLLRPGRPTQTPILFQLELITTATTEGELEAARRHVERYVRRREG